MTRANRGDLVVVCVDKHPAVMSRAGELVEPGPGRCHVAVADAPVADPDYAPVHSPEPAAESVSG